MEGKTKDLVLMADVKLLGEMEDESEYAELLGYVPKSVKDIIKGAYDTLNLITFYTGSEKECNAWTIEKGANVNSKDDRGFSPLHRVAYILSVVG